MKKYLPLILFFCFVKLAIHLAGNPHYGFHRDELLHLSAGFHPAWGYMEFPPFIAFVARLSVWLFDVSLWGMRLFPTLAGLVILILCCAMAVEMGGKKMSVMLAGVSVLAFLPFYRNHLLFQPVAFDQLFWTLGFFFLLKYINTRKPGYLLWMGFTAGLGLMNKYTFLVWGLCLACGLLFHEKGRLFRNKWLYMAGGMALLMTLPNLYWNMQHHFPILQHMKRLAELQSEKQAYWEFAAGQLKLPFTFAVSLLGLYALFFDRSFRKYLPFGVAVAVIFILMWMLQSKSYYFFAAYPVLFAAGAVKVDRLLVRRPKWNYAVAAILIVPVAPFVPDAIPILPVEAYLNYTDKTPRQLTSDYADMFGWEEQVKLVDSLYRALPENERNRCVIWAENYGEAGAILVLGRKYGLPEPVCRHGSFWLWGPGQKDGDVAISVGNEKEVVDYLYEDPELVRMITHPYAIEEENDIPVYICRKPRTRFRDLWPKLEGRVFE